MVKERTTEEHFDVVVASGEFKDKTRWQLTPEEAEFFRQIAKEREFEGKPQVLWGWKRDKVIKGKRYPESRTVYFSADLAEKEGLLDIRRAHLFLDTRAPNDEIRYLSEIVGESRELSGYTMNVKTWKERRHPGYSRLRIEIGDLTDYDRQTIIRRLKGKPRLSIEPPKLIPESADYDISKYAPFAAYCGSGLSAESGLPLLGSIHNLFEVDNSETSKLVFGARDGFPARLVADVEGEFRQFCQFTVDAIKAKPSESHLILAELYQKGILKQILTDNMDDLSKKVNIPYTQTRLSIFPDRFPAEFDPEARGLLVIGVAVDRREVIKQARKRGLKIIVVNPVLEVAPHSRNMDYLRGGDIFFKEEVREALPKIVSASGF